MVLGTGICIALITLSLWLRLLMCMLDISSHWHTNRLSSQVVDASFPAGQGKEQDNRTAYCSMAVPVVS